MLNFAHRFREMCEQDSPVKALQFLQKEVSSVVDHSSPAEAETFRSLLTHLLAPPAQTLSVPARLKRAASTSSERSGSWTSSFPGSRASSKSRSGGNSDAGSGAAWTSQLPGEGEGESALDMNVDGDGTVSYEARGLAETLRGIVDPLEIAAAKAMAEANTTPTLGATTTSAGGHAVAPDAAVVNGPISLTSERYKQRTEVFNSLMKFVSESEKEPVGDLLDLVNQRGVGEVLGSGTPEHSGRAT